MRYLDLVGNVVSASLNEASRLEHLAHQRPTLELWLCLLGGLPPCHSVIDAPLAGLLSRNLVQIIPEYGYTVNKYGFGFFVT